MKLYTMLIPSGDMICEGWSGEEQLMEVSVADIKRSGWKELWKDWVVAREYILLEIDTNTLEFRQLDPKDFL